MTQNSTQTLLLVCSIILTGCQSTVSNGTQIEKASIPSVGIGSIYVPDSWTVNRLAKQDTEITVEITKKLDYCGFPPEPVSIDSVAPGMGVLVKRDDNNNIEMRHFGGFSTSDGGTSIQVVLNVPENLSITTLKLPPQVRRSEIQKAPGNWVDLTTVVSRRYDHTR